MGIFSVIAKAPIRKLTFLIALTFFTSSESCLAKHVNDKCKYPPNEYVYIDRGGKIVFRAPVDTECSDFSDAMASIRIKTKHDRRATFYIDQHGKKTNQSFDAGMPFAEGLAPVGVPGKISFINKTGELAFTPNFESALGFREGLAPVMVIDGFGFIDHSGKIVIAPFFEKVSGFSEGLAAVESQGAIGFINKSGEWQIKPRFLYVDGFSDGLALVRNKESEFFIDHDGRTVITLEGEQRERPFCDWRVSETGLAIGAKICRGFYSSTYASTFTFSAGLSPMCKDKKYGYINKSGEFVVPPKFNSAYPFVEGVARVRFDNKYGFIDKSGKFVIEPKFSMAEDFSEGAAAVAIGHNKWGYIDRSGEFIVQPKYMFAGPFHDDRAKVLLVGYYDDHIK